MPRTRPPYPAECKAEAVRLARSGAKSIPALAADPGVSTEGLLSWLRQADADAGGAPPRRADDRRAGRVAPPVPRDQHPEAGAREPKNSGGLLRQGDRVSRYRFIQAQRAMFPVVVLCRGLQIARSAYYAWARREISARARADEQLAARIAAVHARSRRTYGAPRVHAALRAQGTPYGRKRVARLMRAAGLVGCHHRHRVHTTVADPAHMPAPNLVARDFAAPVPDAPWLGDIMYLPTGEGWLSLAVLLDAHSRRMVGWAIADHLRTELALDALAMAVQARRPPAGLVHHTDRGCQYTAASYQTALARHGLVCSMSRSGQCLDNAMAESFFATLKAEMAAARPWPTRADARTGVFE